MRKTLLLATLLLTLSIGLVAAQDAETQSPENATDRIANVGMFTPDSAFYGVETALDNAGMAVGLKSPADVARERAAEAQAMADKGDYEAAQRAVENMNSAASRASEEDVNDIQQAESVLERVMEDAPEEAQEGLQTAMENVRENGPEELGPPEDVGPDQPDEDSGNPGETNSTSPDGQGQDSEEAPQDEDQQTSPDGEVGEDSNETSTP